MKKSKKLVFFGSGPVGKATLEGLLAANFEIEVIITKPKPAHHRGNSPVLEFAQAHNISVYTPADQTELLDLFNEHKFASSLGLVVDYGIVIPKSVIDVFSLGILNSHFSLLPQWRGADPITFALLSGQKQTGVSLMLIESELDTGRLLAQADYEIAEAEDIRSLTNNLVELSNQLLKEVLPRYIAGEVAVIDQNPDEPPTYSRRLTKEDGIINWQKPAQQLEREVRAYLGWPKSQAKIYGNDVIITKARVAKDKDDGNLVLPAKDSWLEIKELVAPSGRTMSGKDFLHGYKKRG